MPKPLDHPKTGVRGELRRAELVDAGIELLAESGWAGLTHRAVAARANANAGLVHYYFNGSAGLRIAVAEGAATRSIATVFDVILTAKNDTDLLERIVQVVSAARRDRATSRVTAELVTATFADPEVGQIVRAEFRRGRERLQRWLRERHPSASLGQARGAATLIIAAVDGLSLHLTLDPDMALRDVSRAVRRLGGQIAGLLDTDAWHGGRK